MADYSLMMRAVAQSGVLNATDVDIVPNPDFSFDVVELIHDYVYVEDVDEPDAVDAKVQK